MGVQITPGQKHVDPPKSPFQGAGALGTIVGLGVGSLAGNPAAGASVGGALGGATDQAIAAGQSPDGQPNQGAPIQQGDSISRRLTQMNEEPSMVLHQGLQALSDPSVPDEVRQQSAEPMLRAYMKARGIG